MLNLTRYMVRNLPLTKKLFASTATLTSEKTVQSEVHKQALEIRKLKKNPTVAAVFASLKDDQIDEISGDVKPTKETINIDEIIANAKTVNGLLSIAENKSDLSRTQALKIVSVLAEWSTIERAKISEFENDARFVKLCKILGRSIKHTTNQSRGNSGGVSKIAGFRTDDLNVVLGVTGDDEAAKMVEKLNLTQMVKVLKTLASKKRRSVPLLRSLAFNLSSKEEHLNIKECGDVLYSLASLSVPDLLAISKVCVDILEALKNPITKSSPIASVITSLAILRYRDTEVLDTATEWFVKNQEIARVQDLAAIITSLAYLNYVPQNIENELRDKIANSLTELDFKNSLDYLNYCWSLMAIGFYHEKYFDSVMNKDFIEKVKSESYGQELQPSTKMKLLNIDGGVKKFLPKYSGAMLDRENSKDIFDVPIVHNKEKQIIVNALVDALSSLVPKQCLRLNQNTNMGFVIDAEFFVDEKCKPCEKETSNGKKIAMIIHDFRDICLGTHEHVSGISSLNIRLLEKSGYSVISIPYSEFSMSEKLLKRVQYLEAKIKSLSKN